MKYYWINIEKSLDRKLFMEEQFIKLNIDNVRVKAITPDDLEFVLNEQKPYICGNPECKVNNNANCKYEFSCICSHLKAIQEGLKTDDKYFIIMEDDIYIPYKIDFNKLIKDLPEDFDIFQMMVLYQDTTNFLYNNLFLKDMICIQYRPIIPSTGMYLISRKGAEKLINYYYINGKYDFKNYNHIKVADILLYLSVNTYTTTYPYCYPLLKYGSEIHPEHNEVHNKAINSIKTIINKKKENKYILEHFYE